MQTILLSDYHVARHLQRNKHGNIRIYQNLQKDRFHTEQRQWPCGQMSTRTKTL